MVSFTKIVTNNSLLYHGCQYLRIKFLRAILVLSYAFIPCSLCSNHIDLFCFPWLVWSVLVLVLGIQLSKQVLDH